MKSTLSSFSTPNLKSPLMMVFYFQTVLCTYALIHPGFSRQLYAFLYVVIICGSLDFLLNYFKNNTLKVPVSGIVSSYGIFFLFDSNYLSLYALTAVLTIFAKHYIAFNGRHIFNPTNLSLLVIAFAFSDFATINTIRWGGGLTFSVLFVLLGFVVTYFANRLVMSISFFTSFVAFAYVKSLLFATPFSILILPILGPALQLYTFFMVTDPQTTPSGKKQQIAFGVSVAFVDTILRYQQNRYAQLVALVTVTALYAIYLHRESIFKVFKQNLTSVKS